ncbi:MAG: glycosyltransferase, partial [Armatimonadota bacterium]
MRILVLANSDEHGAMGVRSRALFGRLEAHEVHFRYRWPSRLYGAIRTAGDVRHLRPDVVVLLDLGIYNLLAWALAGGRRCAPLFSLTGDEMSSYHRLVCNRGEVFCRMVRMLEDAAFRRSALIGVRGTFHKEHLEERGYSNVRLLPDHVDLDLMRPQCADELRARLGFTNEFVVGIVGTMRWASRWRTCYGWELVEAMAHIESRDVRGLLVGGGDGLPMLQERAHDLGVADRLVFTDNVPHKEVCGYINAMNACLSTQTNNLVGHVRTTIKLPEYLACGKYVIASDVGEASLLLPGIGSLLPYRAGVVRDDDYPLALAREIDRLAAHPELTSEVAERARRVARERFEVGMLADEAEQMLQDIVHGSVRET